jgi:hypothetical protein
MTSPKWVKLTVCLGKSLIYREYTVFTRSGFGLTKIYLAMQHYAANVGIANRYTPAAPLTCPAWNASTRTLARVGELVFAEKPVLRDSQQICVRIPPRIA